MPFQKKDETRHTILHHALTVFHEKGLAAATVVDIAKKARVNKALVYYYFGDKDGLVRHLFEEQFQHIVESFGADDVLQTWEALLQTVLKIKKKYSLFLELILSEIILNGNDVVLDSLQVILKKNDINIQSLMNRLLLSNDKLHHSSLYSREMVGLLTGILFSDILTKNLMHSLFNLPLDQFEQYQQNLTDLILKLRLDD